MAEIEDNIIPIISQKDSYPSHRKKFSVFNLVVIIYTI